MSSQKHHVTIEECLDEDELYQTNTGSKGLNLDNLNQDSSMETESRGNKRQAWNEVDALEEKARSEKMQNQSTAKVNASETARIIKEAQQNSGF